MNVTRGEIVFPHALQKQGKIISGNADIVGIYGQNGSGKTAFIQAIEFLHNLLTEQPLPHDLEQYIQLGRETMHLSFTFLAQAAREYSEIVYDVVITRHVPSALEPESTQILREQLSFQWPGKPLYTVWQYEAGKGLLPKERLDVLLQKQDREAMARVQGSAASHNLSILFSGDGVYKWLREVAEEDQWDTYAREKSLYERLRRFGFFGLYVANTNEMGLVNLNLLQPMHFYMENQAHLSGGILPISLNHPGELSEREYLWLKKIVGNMNVVLQQLIPDLQLTLSSEKQLNENGQPVYHIEFISRRNGKAIPFRYESQGIKRLVGILNVIIGAYNEPDITLAVDELDAGIFEYLLGEFLSVFREGGKGQLIFTSHNLRPLEILNSESIVFTTTDSQHRYARMENMEDGDSMRDAYYRTISLGGEERELYMATDSYELARAMRRAGQHEQA